MKQRFKHLLHKGVSGLALLSILATMMPVVEVGAVEQWTRTGAQQDKQADFSDYRASLEGVSNTKVLVVSELVNDSFLVDGNTCAISGTTLTWDQPAKTKSIVNEFGAAIGNRILELHGYRVLEFPSYSFDQPDSNAIRDMIKSPIDRSINVEEGTTSGSERYYRIMPIYKIIDGDTHWDARFLQGTFTGGCEVKKSASVNNLSSPTRVEAAMVNGELEIKAHVISGEVPRAMVIGFHDEGVTDKTNFDLQFDIGDDSGVLNDRLPIKSGVITAKLPVGRAFAPNDTIDKPKGLFKSKVGVGTSYTDLPVTIEAGKNYRLYVAFADVGGLFTPLPKQSSFKTLEYKADGSSATSNETSTTTDSTTTTTFTRPTQVSLSRDSGSEGMKVTWSSVATAESYRVELYQENPTTLMYGFGGLSGTSLTISKSDGALTAGKTYFARVAAEKGANRTEYKSSGPLLYDDNTSSGGGCTQENQETCFEFGTEGKTLWELYPGKTREEINAILNSAPTIYAMDTAPRLTVVDETSLKVEFDEFREFGYRVFEGGKWVYKPELNKGKSLQDLENENKAAGEVCYQETYAIRYVDTTEITDNPVAKLKDPKNVNFPGKSYDWPTWPHTGYVLKNLKPGHTYAVAVERRCGSIISESQISPVSDTLRLPADGDMQIQSGGGTTQTLAPKLSSVEFLKDPNGNVQYSAVTNTGSEALNISWKEVEGAKSYAIVKHQGTSFSNGSDVDGGWAYATTDGKRITSGNGFITKSGDIITATVPVPTALKNVYQTLGAVALNQDGVPSDPKFSEFVIQNPFAAAPLAVTDLKVKADSLSQTSMYINFNGGGTCFNSPAEKTYEVRYGDQSKIINTPYTELTGLTPGTEYNIAVTQICDSTDPILVDARVKARLTSPVTSIVAKTLSGSTGTFKIESDIEEVGNYASGEKAYRTIIRRLDGVNSIQDAWLYRSSSPYVSSYGANGVINFATGQQDGKDKLCQDAGFCSNSTEEGYVVCTTAAGGRSYLRGAATPVLMKSKTEAAIYQLPTVPRIYATVVGVEEGVDPKDACENPGNAAVHSNEVYFDLPQAPDAEAPTLTLNAIHSNDTVAAAGYITSKQVTLKFDLQDDRDVDKCTLNYGTGEKEVYCKLGNNETSFIIGDGIQQQNTTFTLTATDSSGKKVTSAKEYIVDTMSPQVTSSVGDGTYVSSLNTVEIECTDTGSGCSTLQYKVGNVSGICSAETVDWKSVTNLSGKYTITNIPNTASDLCVRATDNAGNEEQGKKFSLKVDGVVPTPSVAIVNEAGVNHFGGITYTNKSSIKVQVGDIPEGQSGLTNCSITGAITSSTGLSNNCEVDPTGIITINLSNGDGEKNIDILAKTGAGITGKVTLKVIKDTVLPTIVNGTALAVFDILSSNDKGKFKAVPASITDNVSNGWVELKLESNGNPVVLTNSNIGSEGISYNIVGGSIIVQANANGAFPDDFIKNGIIVQGLDVNASDGAVSYKVTQLSYDKAGNATNSLAKVFTFNDVPSTDLITVTGGTPITLPAEVSSSVIPIGITFSASPVFYTITQDGSESSKVPFAGSIYLEPGSYSNFSISFYDSQSRKIGSTFGPFSTTVKLQGALLEFITAGSLRTKEDSTTLQISKIISTGEKVLYTVEKDGVELHSGERVKADYGKPFSTPEMLLTKNSLNDIYVRVTDEDGKKTLFKKSVTHDTKAPQVKASASAMTNDKKVIWTFDVVDSLGGTISKVQARGINLTTGEKGDFRLLTATSGGSYNFQMDSVARPGHEYILEISTEDDLGNQDVVKTTSSGIRPKSKVDLIDMFQKGIAVQGSVIGSDRAKFVISRVVDGIEYTAELPRGLQVIFGDIMKSGKSKSGTDKERLPVGNYALTITTIGDTSEKKQIVDNYVIDPYYADVNADLNGDGKVGRSDEVIFNAAKAGTTIYPSGNTEIQSLKESIAAKLNAAKAADIKEYLKY